MRRFSLCFSTILALAGLLAAVQRVPPQIAPAISQTIGASQPRISPDGQTIAVSYQGAIWTIPRAGVAMTRLTHDAGFDIEPTWSPDGEHIAYVNSPRFGAGDLRIVTKAGQPVNVVKRIGVLGSVAFQKIEWLPGDRVFPVLRVDGRWLVFTENQLGPTSLVVRDLADESNRAVKVERLEFGRPTGQMKVATVDQGQPATVRLSVTQLDGKFSAPPGALYRTLNDVAHFYCEQSGEWSFAGRNCRNAAGTPARITSTRTTATASGISTIKRYSEILQCPKFECWSPTIMRSCEPVCGC